MKLLLVFLLMLSLPLVAADLKSDTLSTDQGNLVITFIGHATLYFTFNGQVVHVDPWSRLADYENLPDADIILITHSHGDHLDPDAISAIRTDKTKVFLTKDASEKVSGTVMNNGDTETVNDIKIEAVPAYNIKHMRSENQPYHPKGQGNGYVISFGDETVYVAGDTEDIPEMALLKGKVDVAFLPMNLPYTMTPEMVAHAAKMIEPDILYPYHYGETDVQQLVNLLQGSGIEIRIRDLQ